MFRDWNDPRWCITGYINLNFKMHKVYKENIIRIQAKLNMNLYIWHPINIKYFRVLLKKTALNKGC